MRDDKPGVICRKYLKNYEDIFMNNEYMVVLLAFTVDALQAIAQLFNQFILNFNKFINQPDAEYAQSL